jgi:hypothetical protein
MTPRLRAGILIALALLTLACEDEHQLRKFRVVVNGEERIVWAHYFDVGQSGVGGCVSFVDIVYGQTLAPTESRTRLFLCGVTKIEELHPTNPPKVAE